MSEFLEAKNNRGQGRRGRGGKPGSGYRQGGQRGRDNRGQGGGGWGGQRDHENRGHGGGGWRGQQGRGNRGQGDRQSGSSNRGRGGQCGGSGNAYEVDKQEITQPSKDEPEQTNYRPTREVYKNHILLPYRPKRDTQPDGKSSNLLVNHYRVRIPEKGVIFHYDVQYNNKASAKLRRIIAAKLISELQNLYPTLGISYDRRSNMYTSKKLPIDDDKTIIELSGCDKDNIYVTIQLVSCLDLSILNSALSANNDLNTQQISRYVQAVDIVIRQVPSMKYLPIGKNFFDKRARPTQLGSGCELWEGFFTSVRPNPNQLSLNADVAYSVFYKPMSLLDFLSENRIPIRENQPIDNFVSTRMKVMLKGVRIDVKHTGKTRTFTIFDVKSKPAHQIYLPENEQSLVEYYKKTYNIKLRNTFQPSVVCGKNKCLFPIELCRISPNQKYGKVVSSFVTSNMIRETCTSPNRRKQNIAAYMNKIEPNNKILKAFKIDIDRKMMEICGRVIDPPSLIFGRKNVMRPDPFKGCWDLRNKEFFSSGTINSWGVMVGDSRFDNRDVEVFVKAFCRTCDKLNLKLAKKDPIIKNFNNSDILEKIEFFSKNLEKPGLIVVILMDRNDIYHRVKQLADVRNGIMTQCILAKNATRPKMQLLCNLLLKVNSKMGGVNHILNPKSRIPLTTVPVMFIGADVTHPSGNFDPNAKSFAAVVASIDNFPNAYAARSSSQTGRMEVVIDLQSMVKSQLQLYRTNNKKMPQRIFYYRDGVGEGQFQAILNDELPAIRNACRDVDKKSSPTISIIVVQKRHHTRMFSIDNPMKNVSCGTIIDTDIIHPKEYDFFMVSSEGIKGTSRPAHYHVLLDENNMSAKMLQRLTYNLCFTFVRATRSVSIPAPVYYAHLVAFRARHLIKDCNPENIPNLIKINKILQNKMYYV